MDEITKIFWSIFLLMCPPFVMAQVIWVDTNWQANNFEQIQNLDADSSPGELILKNNTSNMVLAFTPTALAGIWDIEEFSGKLFFAACTSPMSIDGGKIYSYDFSTNEIKFEYDVYEQGLLQMSVANNKLYVPGLDSQGSGQTGNIYIYDGLQWLCKSTVPQALHVLDLQFYQNKMLVTTETFFDNISSGKVFGSQDEGDTWEELFSVRADPPGNLANQLQKDINQNKAHELLSANSRRLFFMGEYNNQLFVQGDLKEPEGKVLFCYDGQNWSTIRLEDLVFGYGTFKVFNNNLYFLNRNKLHLFDGSKWTSVALPFSGGIIARSLAIYQNNLFSGAENGKLYQSSSGYVWNLEAILGEGNDEIESIGTCHGRLFVGTNGNFAQVYVSAAAPTGYLISQKHDCGLSFAGGNISWQALTLAGRTSVQFQLRTAKSEWELMNKDFIGPDNAPDSFYENSGEAISSSHTEDRWLQYKVVLSTNDLSLMPILQMVTISVNQIGATVGISGHINYYSSKIPVEKTLLSLSGDTTNSLFSNSSGAFDFLTLKKEKNYTLLPSKTDGIPPTTILSYDASLAARMAIGALTNYSAEQMVAADVDHNNTIQLYDAALIARHAVGLPALPTSDCGEWVFQPKSLSFPSLSSSINEANFIAIVLGDVDANWTPAVGFPKTIAQACLDTISASAICINNEICLPFSARLDEDVYSFDLHLQYQVAKFNYAGYALAENCHHFKIAVNDSEPGILKIGGYGTYPLAKKTAFIHLIFRSVNPGAAEFQCQVDNFFLNNINLARGLIATAGMPKPVHNRQRFALYQNQPNPFNPTTEIRFELAEACWVKLTIFDSIGRLVTNLVNEKLSAGSFSVIWQGENDNNDQLSSGLYICSLKAGKFCQTQKMILLR